ncbi:MAG: flavin reductase [Butyrivibrio sp.]|uniref:flavin reductase n=1 Tax=Butyrivibrio sp. TaxID=28121 RepID=UPI001B2D4B19|nr:flavin reductase [Butyrivibrio sp.]MBO6242049.1 flavin reductase [Butyrivibrio sp.]
MGELHVFQPVNPDDLETGPYKFVGEKILITAADGNKVNTMCATWGGVGYIWDKRVTFIFARKGRYTSELINASGEYSISFMNQDKYRGALKYLHMVSGRDEDKIANSRLNINYDDGIPFIDEAREIITCKVLYQREFDEDALIDDEIKEKFYSDGNYHILFIGEVKNILLR